MHSNIDDYDAYSYCVFCICIYTTAATWWLQRNVNDTINFCRREEEGEGRRRGGCESLHYTAPPLSRNFWGPLWPLASGHLPCQGKIELTTRWDNFLRSSLQLTTKNFKHLIDLLMISVSQDVFVWFQYPFSSNWQGWDGSVRITWGGSFYSHQ